MDNIVAEKERNNILKQLAGNNVINYEEITAILDAFQIASGQSFAIGRTRGLLDYIKINSLVIRNENEYITIDIHKKLASFFLNIDPMVNIMKEHSFSSYFK